MKKLNKILRFRFDDETVEVLGKMSKMSDYVRSAVQEKLERDGLLINEAPF